MLGTNALDSSDQDQPADQKNQSFFSQLKLGDRLNPFKSRFGRSKDFERDDTDEDDDETDNDGVVSDRIGNGRLKKVLSVIGALGFVGVIVYVLIASGALASVTAPVLYVPSAEGIISAAGVNIRSLPSTSGQDLGQFPLGHVQKFDGRDSSGEWLRFHRVGYPQSYWVHSEFIALGVPVWALPIDSATRFEGWSYVAILMVILAVCLLVADRWKEKTDIMFLGISTALIFLVKVVPGDSTSMLIVSGIALSLVAYAVISGDLDFTVAYYFAAIVSVITGLLNTAGNFAFVGSTESVARSFAVLGLVLAIIEIVRLKCRTTWAIVVVGGLITALMSFWGMSLILVLAIVLGMAVFVPTWMMARQENKKKPLCKGWKIWYERKSYWVATDIGGITLVIMIVFSIAI